MGPELTSLFLLLSPGLRDQIGQTTRRGTSQTCYSQTLSCLAVDDPADLDVSCYRAELQRQGVTIILHWVISDRKLPGVHATLNG